MESSTSNGKELRQQALQVLAEPNPQRKAIAATALREAWQAGRLELNCEAELQGMAGIPGRPERPELVPPLAVKRRAMNTPEGRATLIHALAHIEFNAINLALDAIWRFANMPAQYYEDWLQVAQEEAYHFSLLDAHLQAMGYHYGDFPAHNSLWELAENTGPDVLWRMALVPRTMEARGLDATPALRAKIAQTGDHAAAEILDIILRDEIGHVAIGNRWYAYLCQQRNLNPITTFKELARRFRAPQLRAPFNLEARLAAGFTETELEAMQAN
ncbi:ferritin-like domain-containing protein [Undibacterium cyanobacteriorum]